MKRSDGRRLLKEYLWQRYNARVRLEALQRRLSELVTIGQCREKVGEPDAEIRASIDAATEEVKEQILLTTSTIKRVSSVIGLLPPGSTERIILELRFINCDSWTDIKKAVYRSRSSCHSYYCKALETLLQKPEVVEALEEYARSTGKEAVFSTGKKPAFPEDVG